MGLTPKRFRRLALEDLVADLPADLGRKAHVERDKQPEPFIPCLRYTEAKLEWVALHEHCKLGQIDPRDLRRMKAIDLEYLAASPPMTDRSSRTATDESAKLQANVTRATREIQRRYARRLGTSIAVLSAALAALAGGRWL